MKTVAIVYFLAVWLLSVSTPASAKSQCSLQIPVPDLSYCDAIGSLEEHIDADVHETKGRVRAVQEYQMDSFKLLDQQINLIMNDSTRNNEDIRDVQEEVQTLKRFVTNLISVQADDETPEVSGTRQKRAAASTPSPSQQLLNSAKANFQQSVSDVLQKLQNISKSVANEVAQSATIHTKLLQELSANQQTLAATEKQLQSLDTAVRNALSSTGTGTKGVSLATVTQEVTDLIINGTVSEQIIQRQLDDLDKVEKQMEGSEQSIEARIATYGTDLNDLDKILTNETQQTANLKGAERIYEDRVGTILYNTTNDVANLKADLASAQQSVSQVGRTVFSTTITVGQFETDLIAFRKSVDSVQSVVTFSQPVQQAQSADILRLKKTLADNINVLKYGFGLRSTPP